MNDIIEGKIQGNKKGYGFLLPINSGEDYFIPHSELRGAMHGDIVIAKKTGGAGERTTARVLRILERGIKELVGTYLSCRNGGFVVPDDDKYFNDIYIPQGKGLRAKPGDKVVCKILLYPKSGNPEGIVSKILGRQFEKNAEIKSIIYNFKFPEIFPANVIKDANALDGVISESEIACRKDLRNEFVFTIDGESAKDFDDAVSIEKFSNYYLLGVHIADVTHYVKSGGFIDAEAFVRGTSVYFPENVIPMLPERLCNDLCSLRPNEDKLALSCIMKVDFNGEVIESEIVNTVINSKYRLTYNYVQLVLDEKETPKDIQLKKSLFLMNELTDILMAKRDKKGSINLEVKESSISIVGDDVCVGVLERFKSYKIIEEFMILANVTVAEYFYFLSLPFVYRVHGKPTEQKLEKFYVFLDNLGVKYKRRKDEVFSKDFQLILRNLKDDVAPLVNRVMLRSMQKAKYSPNCDGHFGLSESYYCHFTSPIRRYPDLAIHRIIKDFLRNGINKLEKKYAEFVENVSIQSSERERVAQDAEIAVDNFYKLIYISKFKGEKFEGVISGVMPFGIFVELENGVEGFVDINTLCGKFFCDKNSHTITNGKKTYKLGQKVKILVDDVDLVDRRAQFVFV